MPAQCAPPPQVAGLLSKKQRFLLEARWAGHGCDACVARVGPQGTTPEYERATGPRNARIQRLKLIPLLARQPASHVENDLAQVWQF